MEVTSLWIYQAPKQAKTVTGYSNQDGPFLLGISPKSVGLLAKDVGSQNMGLSSASLTDGALESPSSENCHTTSKQPTTSLPSPAELTATDACKFADESHILNQQ